MSGPATPRLFRFNHEAMRTEWNLLLVHADAGEATAAAGAAFREVDAIEDELSRFRPTSDTARLGRLRAGEELGLGLAAWDCLWLARDVWQATDGAFDVALGPLYDLWHQRSAAHPPSAEELAVARARSGSHLVELDSDGLRARVQVDGMKFDLANFGKGYALDIAADLLRTDWDIEHALLITGSGSTSLRLGHALNGGPWFVNAGPCLFALDTARRQGRQRLWIPPSRGRISSTRAPATRSRSPELAPGRSHPQRHSPMRSPPPSSS